MRLITKLIIHCSATPPSMNIGAAEIRRWHTDPKPEGNGWSDIGYHFVIRRNGVVENGRPVSRKGAHCAARGGNVASIGVCMVGGVRKVGKRLVAEDNFTDQQWAALDTLVRRLMREHPIEQLLGHRDLDPGKECPSFSVRDAALRRGWTKPRAWR